MIKCFFCSNSKAFKYLFTQCQHLICLNCASLRVNQGVKCCNKITNIDHDVKQELMKKKVQILRNLQNSYQNDHNQQHTLGKYLQQQKLTTSPSKKYNKNNYLINNITINQQIGQTDLQYLESTPINKFFQEEKKSNVQQNGSEILYANQKIIQDKISQRQRQYSKQMNIINQRKYQDQKTNNSPIKSIQNEENPHKTTKKNRNYSNNYDLKQQKENKHASFDKQISIQNKLEFQEILSRKIEQVKQQFKILKIELDKKQEEVLKKLQKVYAKNIINIQQAMKNEEVFSNQLLKKQTMKISLQQVIRNDSFKKVRDLIIKIDQKESQNQFFAEQERLSYQRQDYNNNKKNLGQMNKKSNQEIFKPDFKSLGYYQKSLQNIYISPNKSKGRKSPLSIRSPNLKSKNQNSNQKPNKQLDKIYKKLDQSRSKLEQRIQKHNIFLSQRLKCNF